MLLFLRHQQYASKEPKFMTKKEIFTQIVICDCYQILSPDVNIPFCKRFCLTNHCFPLLLLLLLLHRTNLSRGFHKNMQTSFICAPVLRGLIRLIISKFELTIWWWFYPMLYLLVICNLALELLFNHFNTPQKQKLFVFSVFTVFTQFSRRFRDLHLHSYKLLLWL